MKQTYCLPQVMVIAVPPDGKISATYIEVTALEAAISPIVGRHVAAGTVDPASMMTENRIKANVLAAIRELTKGGKS